MRGAGDAGCRIRSEAVADARADHDRAERVRARHRAEHGVHLRVVFRKICFTFSEPVAAHIVVKGGLNGRPNVIVSRDMVTAGFAGAPPASKKVAFKPAPTPPVLPDW